MDMMQPDEGGFRSPGSKEVLSPLREADGAGDCTQASDSGQHGHGRNLLAHILDREVDDGIPSLYFAQHEDLSPAWGAGHPRDHLCGLVRAGI